jgi:flagellar M-ring protein FliF
MNEKSLAILKQLQAMWTSLSNAKRIALVLGTVGVMCAVLLIAFLDGRENYTVLFADLSPDDAQAISAKLKELKVPAELEGAGTAILVPEARVRELRLELAGEGLPRGGGVGFELFDKTHLGTTEFEQRINNRRALEGELARTIDTIGAVQSARVHLVLPERSVFALRKEEASASVVLRLRAGRAFGKTEVAGVVHLVASAVPGLTEDRVSVVSAEGETLHRPRTDGSSGAGELDEEHEREIAGGLEDRARELLERTVGAGHADVRVSVDLDPSSHEHTDEKFDPKTTSLRSEQKTIERTTTDGPSVAGVPGAKSNLAAAPAPAPAAAAPADPPDGELAANVLRQSWTRNWEVDHVTEKVVTPAGRLARLSVAVLIDGTYNGDGPSRTFVPRDQAELDRLGELVKGVVGFNATRGDSLRIDSSRFVGPEAVDVDLHAPPSFLTTQKKWIYFAGAGVALAILCAIVLVLKGRPKKKVIVATRQVAGTSMPATLAAEPPKASLPRTTSEEDRGRTRTEALEIAVRDPASAAVVLRGWLGAPASAVAPAQF